MTKAKRDPREVELSRLWAEAVLLDDRGRPKSCWFEGWPGHNCEGKIEGAHWIKRQAVERWVKEQFAAIGTDGISITTGTELAIVAAWDPRNGVPACEWHHRHFDGHLVDARNEFVVYRPFVPDHVEDFTADYALESRLEEKCPDLPPDWANV